jgi:hypothetical protein
MNSPKTPTISKYGIATCLLLICGWAVPSAWATGFIASRHFGVGSYPYAVASGDFNGDGKADLAVANYLSNNVSVLIARGNGHFSGHVDYPVTVGPVSVAVGDLNGDGHLDLIVASQSGNQQGDGTVNVLLGNGDGTFQPAASYDAGPVITAVAVGDFNEDGRLDVAAAYYVLGLNSASVSIYLGNGDGTLQARSDIEEGISTATLSVGDLNRDGHLDLVVVQPDFNGGGNGVNLLFGHGNGTFGTPVHIATGQGPTSAAIADFNNDDNPDLAVTIADFGSAHHVSVLLGNGNGTFQPAVNYAVGQNPASIAAADFNGDGNMDLVTANLFGLTVSVLTGNGDGTFQNAANYQVGQNPFFVATGDFNGDHAPDIATANGQNGLGNTVGVLLNDGGTFITAASSPNPSKVGQVVTLTFTFETSFTGLPNPTGWFTVVEDGNNTLFEGGVGNQKKWAFTHEEVSPGTHTITSTYSGDSNYNPNSGPVIIQIVNP